MTYIEKCQNYQNLNEYEIHHIIPKAFNGTDDPTNLIKLTYRQHFIAHLLLAKAFPGTNIGHALYYFIYGSKSKRIIKTSRQFEMAKRIAGIKNSVWHNDNKDNYRVPVEIGKNLGLKIGRLSTDIWKNKVCINNGVENKIISINELPQFLDSGYIKGMIKKHKVILVTNGDINTAIPQSLIDEFLIENKSWYIGQTTKSPLRKKGNCIRMHFNDLEKNVLKSEVETYLKNGWAIGRSNKTKKSCSLANIQIYLDNKNKRVKEEELDYYIQLGWKIGIPLHRKEKNQKNNKDKIIIYNKISGVEKRITINQLELYLEQGWIKGRNPINITKIKISRRKEKTLE